QPRHTLLPALLVTLGLLVAGCGHKSELYLPGKEEKKKTEQSASPAS
ncbi:MAG: hypothetical protein HQL95_15340, partial [Magnetococcales bacterium]|nr:hypothetical protein [Magnetococcales bacterium]